jgi:hypothetical protein
MVGFAGQPKVRFLKTPESQIIARANKTTAKIMRTIVRIPRLKTAFFIFPQSRMVQIHPCGSVHVLPDDLEREIEGGRIRKGVAPVAAVKLVAERKAVPSKWDSTIKEIIEFLHVCSKILAVRGRPDGFVYYVLRVLEKVDVILPEGGREVNGSVLENHLLDGEN